MARGDDEGDGWESKAACRAKARTARLRRPVTRRAAHPGSADCQ